jgi:release factor glutamine methyltransferase
MGTTLHELIKQGEEILRAYHKLDAAIDARLLMCYLLGCKDITLILNRDEMISPHVEESYMYLIAKRTQGIPLQYITKSQEFMGLEFYVDERVLIPRQDTETLVETILDIAKQEPLHQVVEIGVGSGCISISLAHYRKDMNITAIDISQEALEVTLKNTRYHHVEDRISCIKSDLFDAYKGAANTLDLIVSNPPYISREDCKSLMHEVEGYEPRIALTDGSDGLTFYRRISKEAKVFLKPNGLIAYEIGYNQSEAVMHILSQEGFYNIQTLKDLPGKDRVVIARNGTQK